MKYSEKFRLEIYSKISYSYDWEENKLSEKKTNTL